MQWEDSVKISRKSGWRKKNNSKRLNELKTVDKEGRMRK